ncbi:hypothetical protein WAF17_02650 [Bernardetia sp. ABR2-2B]|uniref:hypothetical protein n=1 Tax=Bernardetia sp. ABR2-2B TaxID=3127472 RepID=UPI0030CB6B64
MNNQIEKKNRFERIFSSIVQKRNFFRKKAEKARKFENYKKHYNQEKKYNPFIRRGIELEFRLQFPSKLGDKDILAQTQKEYKRRVAERKKEGKEKFDNSYRAIPLFWQTSLGADYGEFICEHCKSTFYHSPSELYLGKDKLYNCICGHCVNIKMSQNGQEEIFN